MTVLTVKPALRFGGALANWRTVRGWPRTVSVTKALLPVGFKTLRGMAAPCEGATESWKL